MSLTIVIPVYNESERLPTVLANMESFAIKNGFKIILVMMGQLTIAVRSSINLPPIFASL